MRICYFVIGSDTLRNGYHQKIFRTIQVWRELGCETLWVLGSRAGSPAAADFEAGICPPGEARFWTWQSGLRRFFSERGACNSLLQWKPDLIYIRSAYFTPAVVKLLNRVPSCIEINTNEDAERRQYGKLQYLYFRVSSGYVLKRVKGIIAVTREIAHLPRYVETGKPIAVIANGIPLESFEARPVSNVYDPVLIMMATGRYRWHGLDKLTVLARKFPKWRIHIVGDAEITAELAACENVKVHGLLKRAEFEPLLAEAHVGLGPLALHRKDMKEACPLKVREYLSYGLPVIAGYEDTDFPGGAEFFLQIGNAESNVKNSLHAIEAFVAKWMGRRVAPAKIAHLDYRSKEKERLSFLAELAGRGSVIPPTICV
jgi:glycosyltransferase involved in cell wall biosynthesis